ncbi:hypothetical protein GOBAR_DD29830 [Gossypium barbadense]|nr:hypothetical protein GOBAR_DD29830 [Gossypium barbadense]
MHIEEEYYINLYVVGKFVRDLHVRCSGGEVVRFKEDPDTISYFELCKIVKKEHEIGTAIFADDDLMLPVATVEGAGDGNEGVEIAGSKSGEGVEGLNGKGAEVAGSEGGEGLGGKGVEGLNGECAEVAGSKCGEGVEGLGGEGVEVAGNEGGEGGECGKGVEGLDGLDASIEGLEEGDGGLNSCVKETGEEGVEDESDSDLKDENIESEISGEKFEVEVLEKVNGEGLNDRVDREEEGNETEYFDSDDHGSILGSDDDENIDACRRISRFPAYNPNLASSHFYTGMMFKDGELFKSAIRKYLMCYIVDNNLCGAFNSSMVESKFKSIITMLEEIIVKMMTKIVDKRKYYQNETYLKAYAYVLQPINGLHEWRKTGIEPMLPLVEKIMPGRQKNELAKEE